MLQRGDIPPRGDQHHLGYGGVCKRESQSRRVGTWGHNTTQIHSQRGPNSPWYSGTCSPAHCERAERPAATASPTPRLGIPWHPAAGQSVLPGNTALHPPRYRQLDCTDQCRPAPSGRCSAHVDSSLGAHKARPRCIGWRPQANPGEQSILCTPPNELHLVKQKHGVDRLSNPISTKSQTVKGVCVDQRISCTSDSQQQSGPYTRESACNGPRAAAGTEGSPCASAILCKPKHASSGNKTVKIQTQDGETPRESESGLEHSKKWSYTARAHA